MVRPATKDQSQTIRDQKLKTTQETAESWAAEANSDGPKPIKKKSRHKWERRGLRLSESVWGALDRRAAKDGRTLQDLLRDLISIGMKEKSIE